jgi:hypothetical protein
MTNLLKLPTWADDEHVFAIVETPRGSTCKLDFDGDLLLYTRQAFDGGSYISLRLGFHPIDKAEDGDPLDVLIAMTRSPTRRRASLQTYRHSRDRAEEKGKKEERPYICCAGSLPSRNRFGGYPTSSVAGARRV